MSILLAISWTLFVLAVGLTVAVVVSAIRDRRLRRSIASIGEREAEPKQWRQRTDGNHLDNNSAKSGRRRSRRRNQKPHRPVDEPAAADEPAATVDSAFIAKQVRKYKNAYNRRANPTPNKHRSLFDSHAAIDLFADTV